MVIEKPMSRLCFASNLTCPPLEHLSHIVVLLLLTDSETGEFVGDVLVGAWLRNKTVGSSAQWRKIRSAMVIHPQYNFTIDQNDFMLFKIEPVTVSGLNPIVLNTDGNIPKLGDRFTVVGMGYNNSNVNVTWADRLLKVNVRYVDHESCQGQWDLTDDYYYYEEKKVYEDSMWCAIGDLTETKGPAPGMYIKDVSCSLPVRVSVSCALF